MTPTIPDQQTRGTHTQARRTCDGFFHVSTLGLFAERGPVPSISRGIEREADDSLQSDDNYEGKNGGEQS